MAKAQAVRENASSQDVAGGMTDLYFLAMPLETYKKMSDAAAERGLTFAQALGKAIDDFLLKTKGPRLLTEEKEK